MKQKWKVYSAKINIKESLIKKDIVKPVKPHYMNLLEGLDSGVGLLYGDLIHGVKTKLVKQWAYTWNIYWLYFVVR